MTRPLLLLASLLVACSAAPDDASSAAETELAHPPARPTENVSGTTRWYVVDRYRLGAFDAKGGGSYTAWRSQGFDLDGRATSAEDSKAGRGACVQKTNAPQVKLTDGDRGIDNNFGQSFMSAARSIMPDVEKLTNERVTAGGYTLVLRIDDLGSGADDAYAPGALYFVGPRSEPRFSPDEKWPVVGTTLAPIATFGAGYVRNGTWVSGDLGAELPTVALPMLGDALLAPLYGGVFALELARGEGVMAGAVRTTDFLEAMRSSLTRRRICPGMAVYTAYEEVVTNSPDLVAALPLSADPTKACDAMSLGVGFTVKPIAGVEGVTGAPTPPKPDCE